MEKVWDRKVWCFEPFMIPNLNFVVKVSNGGGFPIVKYQDLGLIKSKGNARKVFGGSFLEYVEKISENIGSSFGISIDFPNRDSSSLNELIEIVTNSIKASRLSAIVIDCRRVGQESDSEKVLAWVSALKEVADSVILQISGKSQFQLVSLLPVDGVIVSASEVGGKSGESSAFISLQQILDVTDLPVYLHGGVGINTAPGAVAMGAHGVVLDSALSLSKECAATIDSEICDAIRSMDGSEIKEVSGYSFFSRPETLAKEINDSTSTDYIEEQLRNVSLKEGLVAIGHDGSIAKDLEQKFYTVGGIIQGFEKAISGAIELASSINPLFPDSKLASNHKIKYPIAQGPMTRVSDKAEFAYEVAKAGGLPFIALSLMNANECRELLVQTKEMLNDLTWGVGILGFVSPELRDAQLEIINEIKPPLALIAGGRPSQAAPLEANGVPTFLHVPSPGLLKSFLKGGAKRFVFEGRECGGHVGPRSSFVLWQQQLEVLEEYSNSGGVDGNGSLEGIELLFAGGIHDARSSAGVSAMAAPFVQKGVAIGVLMGTAYLFCQESVTSGAIKEGFQQEALDCSSTVLLETSPGHSTRCVDSPYVQHFSSEKSRLIRAGASTQDMWAELELLNLGRLRIASKGLVHSATGLERVDEDIQKLEGMFMIGDVATLRDQKISIKDLHHDVSVNSKAVLDSRYEKIAREISCISIKPSPMGIAIVGMAGVFPGANSVDELWSEIALGIDAISEVSPERWDPEIYYDENLDVREAGVRSSSKWGGFLSPVPFDALSYGIPPSSLSSIEPVQLLALEVAARALKDAGYADRDFDRTKASVVFGAEAGTDLATAYGVRSWLPGLAGGEIPSTIDEFLPKLTEDSFAGCLSNVIAGRIANRLDLRGINCTVDAACAASLAALDLACKELVAKSSDVVICGGADLHNGIHEYLLFGSVHALSKTGRSRAFDRDADGIVLGEAVGAVVLKRLEDALRDGDRIYAVIDSIAGSSDGRHLGLTAPRKEGQLLALERAYSQAGIDPATVGLVEAHGTGTVVGDRTELVTLTEFLSKSGSEASSCTLGSVKSNIGHTKCAAGIVGLIKAAKAIYHGVRPPTLHLKNPQSGYELATSPFRFEEAARPWLDEERVAGVSSFGFGGANFHSVLRSFDSFDEPSFGIDHWPNEILVFKGEALADAISQVKVVRDYLELAKNVNVESRLRDIAYSTTKLGSGPIQISVVVKDVEEAISKLDEVTSKIGGDAGYSEGIFVASCEHEQDRLGYGQGKVAFLFPGQGSQRLSMLSGLYVAFPFLRSHLVDFVELFAPPLTFSSDVTNQLRTRITDTRVAQPALGIADLTMANLLGNLGIAADLAAGHSYGELAALSYAGSLTESDLMGISKLRGEAIVDSVGADPGKMAAVVGLPNAVDGALSSFEDLVVANRNAPDQCVISGPSKSVEAAIDHLNALGFKSSLIQVACAFHSPLLKGASSKLSLALEDVAVLAPRIPVWSNAHIEPYPSNATTIRQWISDQVESPVMWMDQIEAMYASGARVFIEVGPGRVLTQLTRSILSENEFVAVATDVSGESSLKRLLFSLGELSVNGLEINLEALYLDRASLVDLSKAPKSAPWIINGHLIKKANGESVPGALRPMTEASREPLNIGVTLMSDGEEILNQYLSGMREMVAAQRDVMLSYFGQVPGSFTFEPRP
ncbi:MAG: acyltransferase domain-containing protein, partial [Acidimicrobiales bacterium]|nr:acyltransferase domain-containing protein [Acidimicrobiales bacterium]